MARLVLLPPRPPVQQPRFVVRRPRLTPQVHEAAASLAASAEIAAVPRLTLVGVLPLSSVATINPTAGLTLPGASGLSAAAVLNSVASITLVSASALSAVATIGPTAVITFGGVLPLTAIAAFDSVANMTFAGVSPLTSVATLGSAASITFSGSTSLSGTAEIATVVTLLLTGMSSLVSEASLTSAAVLALVGAAAMSASSIVTFAAISRAGDAPVTRTGSQLLQALSEFINDWHTSSTTSAGNAGGTTVVDAGLAQFGTNRLLGRFVRTPTGTPVVRVCIANTGDSLTVSQPFAAQVGSGVAYELHKYDPAKKFLALDKARLAVLDHLYLLKLDDTITSDGLSRVYDIPESVEQGPHFAYIESPSPVSGLTWNFLKNPIGDSLTGWTAVGATASIVTPGAEDLVIPKYDLNATKLTVAASTEGNYTQTIADMVNDVTAAKAADRRMSCVMWVYATEASRVTLQIIDDAGISQSAPHQGLGWEMLQVSATPPGNNSTTLSVRLNVTNAATPMTIYWNRAWFYFGEKERVVDSRYAEEHPITVRRDDTTRHVILGEAPPRGYQVRLAGKVPLSSLGSNVATQMTNTMEVDVRTQEVLVAYAAELLLQWESIKSDSVPDVAARIANVHARLGGLARNWSNTSPQPNLRNPFA